MAAITRGAALPIGIDVAGASTVVAIRRRLVQAVRDDSVLIATWAGRFFHRPNLKTEVLPAGSFFDYGTRPDRATTPYIERRVILDVWTPMATMSADVAEDLAERITLVLAGDSQAPQLFPGIAGELPGGQGRIEYCRAGLDRDAVEGDVRRKTVEFEILGYDYRVR